MRGTLGFIGILGSTKLKSCQWLCETRFLRHFTGYVSVNVGGRGVKPSILFALSGNDSELEGCGHGSAVPHSKYLFYVESCFSSCFSATRNDSLLKSCTFAIGSSPSSPVHTGRWVEKKSSLPLNREKQRENAK